MAAILNFHFRFGGKLFSVVPLDCWTRKHIIVHYRSSQDEKIYKSECHLHTSDVSEASLVAVDNDCGSHVG